MDTGTGAKPNLKSRPGSRAATGIDVLYITADLREADYLTHNLGRIAPNLHLEASPPKVRHVAEQLRVRHFHIVLIDNGSSRADRLRLIETIDRHKPAVAIVLISGAAKDSLTQTLLAHADDHVPKGPNFLNELADVLHRTFDRLQLGVTKRTPAAIPRDVAETTSENAGPEAAEVAVHATSAEVSKPQKEYSRTSLRRRVYICCEATWDGEDHTAYIHDLSEEGAFLEMSPAPPRGTEIVIRFDVDACKVSQDAVVAHQGWYLDPVRNFDGCGVHFRNLSGATRNLLRDLVNRNLEPAPGKVMLTR